MRHERIAFNQVEYHLNDRNIERDLLSYCAERGIAVVAYSPFGQGDFPSPRSEGGRLLADIAQRYGRTSRQVALNFLTRYPNVFAIPKATNPDHVRDNSGSVGWNLNPEDIAAVDQTFQL